MSPSQIVRTYQNSGLHGDFQYVSRAYAVAQYTTLHSPAPVTHMESNRSGSHAENEMIQHLEDVLEREVLTSQTTIKLYVNFSPCSECSRRIMEFLERADNYYGIQLSLEIVVAHLYKIRRPTCLDGTHSRNHSLPYTDTHKMNLQGLRNLVRFGVLLSPFDEEEWGSLWNVLNTPGEFPLAVYQGGDREAEDENLLTDLEQLGL